MDFIISELNEELEVKKMIKHQHGRYMENSRSMLHYKQLHSTPLRVSFDHMVEFTSPKIPIVMMYDK